MKKTNKRFLVTKCGFLLAAFAVLVSNTYSLIFAGEPEPPKSLLK